MGARNLEIQTNSSVDQVRESLAVFLLRETLSGQALGSKQNPVGMLLRTLLSQRPTLLQQAELNLPRLPDTCMRS